MVMILVAFVDYTSVVALGFCCDVVVVFLSGGGFLNLSTSHQSHKKVFSSQKLLSHSIHRNAVFRNSLCRH